MRPSANLDIDSRECSRDSDCEGLNLRSVVGNGCSREVSRRRVLLIQYWSCLGYSSAQQPRHHLDGAIK